jgi:acetyl esterase/lipase
MRLTTPEGVETDAEHWIDSEGGPVRVRIFRHGSKGAQPGLIYMHGGAWMQGSPETHWDITVRLADWARITVISIDYALSPEHPYPAAFLQCVEVLRWTHANAATLEIDPGRIAIGGDSAGGNLAAAVALKARDEGLPLGAQLLIYPACDFDRSRASYAENAEGPLLKVAGMEHVNRMYSPETERLKTDPFVAPLVAASHKGLPPAFIGVAQYDPLRDSGLAYAEALSAAGVEVEVDQGEGLIHGYMRSMEYCADAEDRLSRMADWLAAKLR